MKKETKEIVLGIIVLLVIGIALANALPDGIEKHQRNQCLQWRVDAETRKAVFYLTPIQKEQCDALKIEINAPVKKEKL
ncbi:MAG: hypothetical protein M1170_01415 [Patescibacteria group bacterium]|nr:hypothetical protein [Patescibacteria group bacterium]